MLSSVSHCINVCLLLLWWWCFYLLCLRFLNSCSSSSISSRCITSSVICCLFRLRWLVCCRFVRILYLLIMNFTRWICTLLVDGSVMYITDIFLFKCMCRWLNMQRRKCKWLDAVCLAECKLVQDAFLLKAVNHNMPRHAIFFIILRENNSGNKIYVLRLRKRSCRKTNTAM